MTILPVSLCYQPGVGCGCMTKRRTVHSVSNMVDIDWTRFESVLFCNQFSDSTDAEKSGLSEGAEKSD